MKTRAGVFSPIRSTPQLLKFAAIYVKQGRCDPVTAYLQVWPKPPKHKDVKLLAKNMVRRKDVQDEVRRLIEPVVKEAQVSAKAIVERFAQIAFADPRELSRVRYVNCRHCWGVGHHYQFTEHEAAIALAKAVDIKAKVKPTFPGGTNFKPLRAPHPDCPECGGEGISEVVVGDTGSLSLAGQALYAGAKHGKYGIEVMTHSQMDALKALAQFFGITPATVQLIVNNNDDKGTPTHPDFTREQLLEEIKKRGLPMTVFNETF